MKKKEKLKSVVKPTKNQILISDLELRQISGTPSSGFLPQYQGRTITTNGGKDSAEMTETNTIWGTKTEVDSLSGETTPWIEKQCTGCVA